MEEAAPVQAEGVAIALESLKKLAAPKPVAVMPMLTQLMEAAESQENLSGAQRRETVLQTLRDIPGSNEAEVDIASMAIPVILRASKGALQMRKTFDDVPDSQRRSAEWRKETKDAVMRLVGVPEDRREAVTRVLPEVLQVMSRKKVYRGTEDFADCCVKVFQGIVLQAIANSPDRSPEFRPLLGSTERLVAFLLEARSGALSLNTSARSMIKQFAQEEPEALVQAATSAIGMCLAFLQSSSNKTG